MKNYTNMIQKLSNAFEALRGVSLISGQHSDLHDKLNVLESSVLKEVIVKYIPHVTEIAADILLFRDELSEEEYMAVTA